MIQRLCSRMWFQNERICKQAKRKHSVADTLSYVDIQTRRSQENDNTCTGSENAEVLHLEQQTERDKCRHNKSLDQSFGAAKICPPKKEGGKETITISKYSQVARTWLKAHNWTMTFTPHSVPSSSFLAQNTDTQQVINTGWTQFLNNKERKEKEDDTTDKRVWSDEGKRRP